MGYYRGDYYRGDYYRGDPFIGLLAKKVAPKAFKWAVKAAQRTVRGITGSSAGAKAARDVARDIAVGSVGVAVGRRSAMPSLAPPGQEIDFGSDTDVERAWAAGWRPVNKYRKMNPLNPKALRRALRRAEGFEKFAARTVNALYKTVGGRRTRVFKKGCK